MIVSKFCVRYFVSLGTRVGPTEGLKVCFNLLVDTFCLTISLRMIGSGEGEVVVEKFAKFFGKSRGKLWATIRDDFVVEPETEVYSEVQNRCNV